MITFETEEDFERDVMRGIENRLQLSMYSDWHDGDPITTVQITSTDGIVFKSDYAVK